MRTVLLISLFVIWHAGPPGWRLMPEERGISIFFAGYGLVLIAVVVAGRGWVRRLGGSGPVARPAVFFWLLSVARFAVVVWFTAGVCVLGWRHYVDRIAGTTLLTPAALIGLTPALLAWAGLWWAAFPVERAVREMNVVYDVEAGLPVFAYPTLIQYLANRFRGQMLFMAVPILMWVVTRDLFVTVWTGLLKHPALGDSAESAVQTTAVLLVMLTAPAILRHVLQTMPLPDSPLRESLCSVSRSAGVGVRDILLWNTHHNSGNAAVMGLVRPVRYVMLSDLLVETLTEPQIRSVFAHELGHVRHRHLFWIASFLVVGGTAVFGAVDRMQILVHGSAAWKESVELVSAGVGAAVLMVAFGFVSRWFERQADVFAARSGGVDGSSDVERGAHVFAAALEKVAVVNNIPPGARNFRHGTIESRTRYVMKLATDPAEAERFDRMGKWITTALATTIVTGAAAAVVMSL